jgi:hypothetical protein
MDKEISQIILDELRAHREESRDRHDQLDIRVRNVEGWQKNAEGKITIIGLVCTATAGFVAWISTLLHK